jgi:hypothetical protein
MKDFYIYIRLNVSWQQWRELSKSEVINVDLSKEFVESILSRKILPAANKERNFWSLLLAAYLIAVIAVSVWLSWWFLLGLVFGVSIGNMATDAMFGMIRKAAWEDEQFYEGVRDAGLWWFQIESRAVNKFDRYFVGPDKIQREYELRQERLVQSD